MKQQAQKKAWKTPELIILVRSKPEEAVLEVCKSYVVGSVGALSLGMACGAVVDSAGCPACSGILFS